MAQAASSSQLPHIRVFLSHAGEDKETIARPLYHRLREHGVSVFLDVMSFALGDHCPNVMEHAMQTSSIGVFILSPEFIAKEWTMRELMAFVRRYDEAVKTGETAPLLISVFYRLDAYECGDDRIFDKYSSMFVENGLFKRLRRGTVLFQDVTHALERAATLWGIENDTKADNSNRPDMARNRKWLIEKVLDEILNELNIEKRDCVDHHIITVYGQREEQDQYRPCNVVPPNPPMLTLDYNSTADDGIPKTCEGKLKRAVLGRDRSRIVGVVATGKGGVGKTCALRGLADDDEIKRTFTGGILYIGLGNNAGIQDVVHGIATIVDRTGGRKVSKEMESMQSAQKVCEKASRWFGTLRCLFLIDDIWEVNGIDLEVLGTVGSMVNKNSRMVYTTREKSFMRAADEVIEFREKEPFGDLSKRMLMRHARFDESVVLKGKNMEAFYKLLDLCQGLPLAFGIVGASVFMCSGECDEKQDAWSEFHKEVQQEELMNIEAAWYGKLSRVVDVSLEVLEKRNAGGKFEEWFRGLCVVQKQQEVPVHVLEKVWNLESIEETMRVVTLFAGVSVVEMKRRRGAVFVRVHDLILDIADERARTGNGTQKYFRTLVCNYISFEQRKNKNDSCTFGRGTTTDSVQPQNVPSVIGSVQEPEMRRPVEIDGEIVEESTEGCVSEQAHTSVELCHAWWNFEDDEYIHNNLCRILRGAGHVKELLRVLSKPQWIVMRLVEDGLLGIEQDLEHGRRAIVESNCVKCRDRKEHLEMIGRAARLGAIFVNENCCREEGWFQVQGRLLWHATQSKLTKEFVKRMDTEAPRPWLKASIGLLQQAGCISSEVVYAPYRFSCYCLCLKFTRKENEILILWSDLNANLYVSKYNRTHNSCRHQQLRQEVGAMSCVLCASFLDDGLRVVTAHRNRRILVWSTKTGACERIVEHRCRDHVEFVDFCRDGAAVACQKKDYSIELWDTQTGDCFGQPLRGHTYDVTCVAMNSEGTCIVSGSWDGTVRVWDAHNGNAVGDPLQGHTNTVNCVAVSSDGTRIVSGSDDCTVRVWDARHGNAIGQPLQGHSSWVHCVAVSADGTRITSGSEDRTIRVWDTVKGIAVSEPIQGHSSAVRCVALSADSTRIVSGAFDHTVRVWDAHTGSGVGHPLEDHTGWVRCAAVSADGTRIVSVSGDDTVCVWDAHTGNGIGQPLKGHTGWVRCVAVNADGTRIVSGSDDGTVRVWGSHHNCGNAAGASLIGHTAWVSCVAICADGTRIVSGSYDCTARVWDAQSGNAVCHPLVGHMGWVSCVAVNADGTRIVSGSDHTVYVWDVHNGKATGQPLQGHTGWVKCVAVSADGTRIVSDDFETKWLWAFNDGVAECVLTSWNAEWQNTIDPLELTWSTGLGISPVASHGRHVVSGRTEDGSVVVLGTCEQAVDNYASGDPDIFFDKFFRFCQIVR